MTLGHGRKFVSIPGPSVAPDSVLNAMHQASPNIYTGALVDLVADIMPRLERLAGAPDKGVAIYIGNGHAAWEAALTSMLSKSDEVLALYTGRFAKGWADMAEKLGVRITPLDFGGAATLDIDAVMERLNADKSHKIKAVITVQSDTASSAKNDIAGLGAAIQASGHPALFMVDAICSFGCEPLDMGQMGIDIVVAGCQKGLMVPAGLSFVFVSERAKAARERADLVTPYWDIKPRIAPDLFYQHFAGTPPSQHLYGLAEALRLIEAEGREAVWARHHAIAQGVWAAMDAWGEGGELRMNMANPSDRSWAVTAIHTGEGDGLRLRTFCEEKLNVVLGMGMPTTFPSTGYSDAKFRIGHMGHINLPMIMGTLGAVDAGLKALDIPHGNGALDAASAAMISAAGLKTAAS